MASDQVKDAPDVDEKGLSAEERDRKEASDRLYRWMKGKWRRT